MQWVCASPLSTKRRQCQPSCRGRRANLSARIVIRLAGSACYWANLHPPKKKVKIVVLFFFSIFFPNHSQLFKALQLRLFLDYSFVLASAQKKEVPFQKRTNWMTMWQQVEDREHFFFFKLKLLRAKCLSYRAIFPAARKPVALTSAVWNKLMKIILSLNIRHRPAAPAAAFGGWSCVTAQFAAHIRRCVFVKCQMRPTSWQTLWQSCALL